MTYFMMRPCKTTAAYVATLRARESLDLPAARDALTDAGYAVTDCGVLLLIHDEPDRTLYRTGRILVKVDEESVARRAVEEIYELLGLVPRMPA